jgi:hypothetical protein
MNYSRSNKPVHYLSFTKTFLEAIPVMKEETVDFFEKYLTQIDGNEFWEKCRLEFPY